MWSQLITLSFLFLQSGESSIFTKDGIKIERGGSVQTTKTIYQVYVSVEAPRFHDEITIKLGNLGKTIYSATRCETCYLNIDRETQIHWNDRLSILGKQVRDIKTDLQYNGIRSRQKRSILQPVYSFLGIASHNDLSAIKLAIRESRLQNKIITHNEQIMASFVHSFSQNVSNAFTQYDRAISNLEHFTLQNINFTSEVYRQLNLMKFTHGIDVAISDFQVAIDSTRDELANWHRSLSALHRGQLTQDLMGINQLASIISKIRLNLNRSPNITWIYRYAKVVCINEDENNVIFRIQIPILTGESYVEHILSTYPILADSQNNILRRLIVPKQVAINSRSSAWFNMDDSQCFGDSPIICLVNQLQLQPGCESALIGGTLLDFCNFQLTQTGNRSLTIYREGTILTIIPYKKLTLMKRCLHFPAESISVSQPIEINLEPNCILDNNEIQIRPTIYHTLNIKREVAKLPLSLESLNITSPKLPKHVLDTIKFNTKAHIMVADFPHLETMSEPFTLQDTGIISFFPIICSLIALIVSLTLLSLYAARTYQWKCFRKDNNQPQMSIYDIPLELIKTPTNSLINEYPEVTTATTSKCTMKQQEEAEGTQNDIFPTCRL